MMNRDSSITGSSPTLMFSGNYSRNNEQNSELFASFPALGDAAAYLTETTSFLTRCFGSATDESVLNNDAELVSFSSGEAHRSESVNDFSNVYGSDTTTLANEKSTTSLGDFAHAGNGPIISASVFQMGPSIVQGSGEAHRSESVNDFSNVYGSDTTTVADEKSTTSLGDSAHAGNGPIISANVFQMGPSIFQGLISRARKTVLGSADDIGWLQRAHGMPPVEDGTKRFIELLDNIRKDEHKLPDSLVYLLVPGLFSNHGPLYFVNTKTCFSRMGLTCHIAKIHSEASVEKNAREIKDYIEEIYWGSKKRIMLLGHSKGGVDSAAALSLYWPDLKDKVAGLALAQSPYGGSPIASDILREGQLGDYVQLRKIMQVLICKVLKGDPQALEDLTYEKRREFLCKHPLPSELPVVSFHTEAGLGPSVLATLSQVAHAELPIIGEGQSTKVPVIMPLSAAMAACAQLLQVRYGEKSDGLVTRRDAEVPGSVVVRPERKLDHAWMVYSTINDSPGEADASQVCEALLTLLVEIGQKRRHAITMKDE